MRRQRDPGVPVVDVSTAKDPSVGRVGQAGGPFAGTVWTGHARAAAGVDDPVATDPMPASDPVPATGHDGSSPQSARGAWWSMGIVTLVWVVSGILSGVAGDPVMGAGWGGVVAPVVSGLFGLACLAFVVPLVLGIRAVWAGNTSAWVPIVYAVCAFAFFGFSVLLGLAL